MIVTQDVSYVASLMLSTQSTVVAYPTETFYGLGARIDDAQAVERIVRIKGRDADRGMIVLVHDIETVLRIAKIGPGLQEALAKIWPAALSVILAASPALHPLLAPGGKVAVRISPHPLARGLTGLVGPITSTSANRTGMPPACSAGEVVRSGLDIDAVLDGGETPGAMPSTLVDLTSDTPVCLREGAVAFEEVLPLLMGS
ncbi:MAG TPA: L-threonylcarbamoyladenylate synthase [Deltaproteobacteria bacterium]|nr:L-threonylcarbamoyladenylate synthase [Deltaproteobacteria bacterium]HPP79651.1 L-threonylcarbamoyladenylate synthase [Deltaproteobacteria bacterium]